MIRARWRLMTACSARAPGIVLTLALLSCVGTDVAARDDYVPVPATPPTLQVEVGTGVSEFVALAAGDPVDLVYGSQGGFHVWTAVRVHDEGIDEVQVNLSSRLEDGTPGGQSTRTFAKLSAPRDGWRSAAGLRNFVAETVAGKRLLLQVEVIARDHRHGAAERSVVASRK